MIVTRDSAGPIAHEKVMIGGGVSEMNVARIERHGAFEACRRFAPASLSPVDAADVSMNSGIVRGNRRGDFELLKSCVVILFPLREAKS